jgi:hypothetical protein
MKIICIGRNYTNHIEEKERKRPQCLFLFSRFIETIHLLFQNFRKMYITKSETIVKISKVGKYIEPKFHITHYDEIRE